jgi:hypothetical protein
MGPQQLHNVIVVPLEVTASNPSQKTCVTATSLETITPSPPRQLVLWLVAAGKSWNLPSCGPDLAPTDFRLFVPLKKHLDGKLFAADAGVKQACTSRLHILDSDCFNVGYKSSWHGRENVYASFMTTWRFDVYHLLPV